METPSSSCLIDWAVAQQALPGQIVSGDAYVVVPHERGFLAGVLDGLGHGEEAAQAAAAAVECLQQEARTALPQIFHRCHSALGKTRGAVMTLADIDLEDRQLTLCGVGNVEALLYRASDPYPTPAMALLQSGIVGVQLPSLYPTATPFGLHDLLIMVSDGIRIDFGADLDLRGSPQRVADHLLRHYFKGTDDGVALVIRFRAPSHE